MSDNRFPAGWDEAKVRSVIAHYEGQSEEEAVIEDEAGTEQVPDSSQPKIPSRTRTRVFISHSSKDKEFAVLVAHKLQREKLAPWLDSAEILIGDDIIEKIGEGLKTMDLLLFLVSREALESPWVERELKFASMKTIKDKEIRILPFLIDNTPIEALPWYVRILHARYISPDSAGAGEMCHQVQEVLRKRVPWPPTEGAAQPEFKEDRRVDLLIKSVKLGDWDAAEIAALEIVKTTDASGRNELFDALLEYQDLRDEDPRFWGALHTIECCVRLAPWLITHGMISRMASHQNFSVRSSAAAICMDLAHSAPDRVPFDIVTKLSSHEEDWYVETPANSAIKAMARAFPAVLKLFFKRIRSTSFEERQHAAYALCDVASQEPEILNPDDLQDALLHLRAIRDKDTHRLLAKALSKVKAVEHRPQYRYGF